MILAALAVTTVALPSPFNALSPQPPLGGPPVTEAEAVVHRVDTTERVSVRVDGDGRPFAVTARQRLVVRDRGDYVFYVPAPVLDVVAAPGSESLPGQRQNFVLWSGFNARRKVLAADARLRPAASAKVLPLRLERRGATIVLRNATAIGAGSFAADAVAPPLARYLDSVRAAVRRGRLPPAGTAAVRSDVAPLTDPVEAPLRLTGRVGGRRVDAVLGDSRPLELAVPRGNGGIDLRVDVVPPLRLLTPPGGARTWLSSGAEGRLLLARANAALLRIARARQYDEFLADPDPRGGAQTTYVYRSGRRPAVAAAPPPSRGGGSSALRAVLVALGGVVAAGAALVAWARA